jgi:molybdenum cofactor synthesis domain-containing protein
MHVNPTASVILIGNEVLSGRTQDLNLRYLGRRLSELGIPVREARVIPDVAETIIATVNEMRARYGHVFTTGGIGPTHDDITSECIAAAFGVPWEPHPDAWRRLEKAYEPGQFNAARQRMATMPRGAALIDNPISTAPGFTIGNVHVLAGVPRIMEAMFERLAPYLERGWPIEARAVHVTQIGEGLMAEGLARIQDRFPEVQIGSYPFYRASGNGVAIVVRGTDPEKLDDALTEVRALIMSFGATAVPGEPASP